MGVVTSGILMVAGACVALGIIHFRFWVMERTRHDELAFSLTCFSVAVFAVNELLMTHAATPADYFFYAYSGFLLGSFMVFGTAWFAYVNLKGRRWLFWVTCAWRSLLWIIHFILPNGLNFREIKAVGHVTVLGESLGYPIAVTNPWTLLAQAGHIVLIVFCLDSSIRTWRRGERRKALVFGTGVVLFGATLLAFATLVVWGIIGFPIISALAFLFVIVAMVYELDFEMKSSAILSEELIRKEATLTETLKNLNLSANAANVGMWTRKIGEDEIWVSEKTGEIWGLPAGHQFTREDFFQSLHPDDREFVFSTIQDLETGKNEFQIECRVIVSDGRMRWVEMRGKVELVDGARMVRGAIVDITERKLAEEAVHRLSHRLINAQEKERARLARELHDDFSQSLAMLSIHLTLLRDEFPENVYLREQVEHLISEIERGAASVRRISHELHPARLRQLGLEPAMRGFCRELVAAHSLKLDFRSEDLPRKLPDEVALCIYRVTQESLQNVVKHSGATEVRVKIELKAGDLRLSIFDNGCGFDMKAAAAKDSLGLISIDERVRGVNGTVRVNSSIGAGTKIEVNIPINYSGFKAFHKN